jgi:Raf kinase inhibitor-like YbhB/YbcL family protein
MRIWSDSFRDGGALPPACALCAIDLRTHTRLSANRNPHLAWDDVPRGTGSLTLFVYESDVPSVTTDVNQEGKTVPADVPRVDFYHWTLADIPVALKSIGEGQCAGLVIPRSKPGPLLPVLLKNGIVHQLRQGINDYTHWFAGDPGMAGDYFGYDGPCPPWNDERIHHYIFRIYALDEASLPLEGRFTGPEARQAIHGHILDEAQIVGAYSLHPKLAQTLEK